MSFPTIAFETAWAGYLRWAARLPAQPAAVATRRIQGVLDVAEHYDLFVLDAFGVLNLGNTVLPAGLAAVAALKERGKRVCVLTNDASAAPAALAARHRGRGYAFADADVVSGAGVLPLLLGAEQVEGPWLLVGTEMTPPALGVPLEAWDGSDTALDLAGGFLMLETDHWDEARQARLQASLARRLRPLVVANPDVAAPYTDFLSADPGWFANRLADAVGVTPRFLGKPFPEVYRVLRERFPEVPAGRILAVGDSPHTDVLGARAAGLDVLLVESGFLRGRDSLALCREAGLSPTYLAAAI